jgi:hypothetical protein
VGDTTGSSGIVKHLAKLGPSLLIESCELEHDLKYEITPLGLKEG